MEVAYPNEEEPMKKEETPSDEEDGDGGDGECSPGCFSIQGVFYPPGGWPFLINLGTGPDTTVMDIIGQSSYQFFLFPNVWAFALAVLIVVFQAALFYVLWHDTKNLDYDKFEGSLDRWVAIMCAAFLLALKISSDVGKGFELIWYGICCLFGSKNLGRREPGSKKEHWWRSVVLLFVGFCIFGVATLCVWVGITSSLNQESASAVITRATVATWIAGMDEQMYRFMEYWSHPAWYKYVTTYLNREYGKSEELTLTQEEKASLKKLSTLTDEEIDALKKLSQQAVATVY